MRLAGKVALITGAGSGLGLHAAQVFAKEGAKVVITDINEEAGVKLADEIKKTGSDALFIKLNVLDKESWDNAVKMTLETYSKVDILINSAGISIPKNVLETSIEDMRKSFALNVEGPMLGMQAVAEAMKQNGGGSIVNIASMAGVLGLAKACSYSTTKGAVRSLSKSAAVYFAKAGYNIRVNILNPYYVKTPMLEAIYTPEQMQALKGIAPLNDLSTLDDVSNALLYLASDESRFMTGFDFNLDGGYQAGL